jgi:hypothetical protein
MEGDGSDSGFTCRIAPLPCSHLLRLAQYPRAPGLVRRSNKASLSVFRADGAVALVSSWEGIDDEWFDIDSLDFKLSHEPKFPTRVEPCERLVRRLPRLLAPSGSRRRTRWQHTSQLQSAYIRLHTFAGEGGGVQQRYLKEDFGMMLHSWLDVTAQWETDRSFVSVPTDESEWLREDQE